MPKSHQFRLTNALSWIGLICYGLINPSYAASIDKKLPYASYIAQVSHSGVMLGLHRRGDGKLTPRQFKCYDEYHLSQITKTIDNLLERNIPEDDLTQLNNFFAKPQANKILQMVLENRSISEDLSNDKNLTTSEKNEFKKFSETAVYQKYFIDDNGYDVFSAKNNQEIFVPLIRQSFDYCQIDRNILKGN